MTVYKIWENVPDSVWSHMRMMIDTEHDIRVATIDDVRKIAKKLNVKKGYITSTNTHSL